MTLRRGISRGIERRVKSDIVERNNLFFPHSPLPSSFFDEMFITSFYMISLKSY